MARPCATALSAFPAFARRYQSYALPSVVACRLRSTAPQTRDLETEDLCQRKENPPRPAQSFPEPLFGDTKDAYRSKTTRELLRAASIFQMCTFNFLLQNQVKILAASRKLLGKRVYQRLLKRTVYAQFMAGETDEEVLRKVEWFQRFGVYSMIAYTPGEIHGAVTSGGSDDQDAWFNSNYENVLKSVDLAAKMPSTPHGPSPKTTYKLSCLAHTDIFQRVSEIILQNRNALQNLKEQGSSVLMKCLQRACAQLEQGTRDKLPLPSNIYPTLDNIDNMQLNLAFNLHFASALEDVKTELGYDSLIGLTVEEEEQVYELWRRLYNIAQRAHDREVVLVSDAEQTYLQEAMDCMTLDLMRIFNKTTPTIYNTYQCYLKRTYRVIRRDLDMCHAENLCWGGKIVRGAYMIEERQLAEEKGYEDPVNPSYEATTQMYYLCANELLEEVQKYGPGVVQALFATHNEDTVHFVLDRMKKYSLPPAGKDITFAQIIGMRDHVSFPLGQAGCSVQKLMHYGPVEDGVAYLSRRLQENNSGMATANHERDSLFAELKRRLKTGNIIHRPVPPI